MAWAEEQELQAVSRRTRADLERVRAEGKTMSSPARVDDHQVEAMARLRLEGQSLRSIGRVFGVSRPTVQRRLQEAVNLEDSKDPRSLAGKPLAGFRATPGRRITVLYGIIVYVIRCKNSLLHRLSMLRK